MLSSATPSRPSLTQPLRSHLNNGKEKLVGWLDTIAEHIDEKWGGRPWPTAQVTGHWHISLLLQRETMELPLTVWAFLSCWCIFCSAVDTTPLVGLSIFGVALAASTGKLYFSQGTPSFKAPA